MTRSTKVSYSARTSPSDELSCAYVSMALLYACMPASYFACPFEMRTANGLAIPLRLRGDYAKRSKSDVAYILTFAERRKHHKPDSFEQE